MLLKNNEEVGERYRARFKYLLVDEYQDTNHVQYLLLKNLLGAHNNICVVGDEDQSIYKFRGADIQNILKFETDFPGAKTIKLEQNYRSSQNILNVAGAVVENNTERKGKTLWTDNGSGDVLTCYSAGSPREEAGWIAEKIQMTHCRIYIAGQNLLTFSKYIGMEPELTTSANAPEEKDLAAGIDWGTYPSSRTYMIGLNVTF